MEKKAIRKLVFERRAAGSETERLRKSCIICNRIMESEAFRSAACIYAYMDCKGEVCMEALLKVCWELKKPIAVPKVFGKELRFYYISSYRDVESGYYQVPEPVTGLPEADETEALVIVPGVAFDEACHRCGYGGGFYDRYLSVHKEHMTISPAFEFQVFPEIPAEKFDILPQRVVTEERILEV